MPQALDTTRWVPKAPSGWKENLPTLLGALEGRKICLLTGAGCSTNSGIPDYRGGGTERRARNPIQFKQFVESDAGRRRYWARSMIGWPRFRSAKPNESHLAVADLENTPALTGVITQNVDRLHQKAGSRNVVELHGALEEVVCLDCRRLEHRDELQERLTALNPSWLESAHELAPDGDADLELQEEHYANFEAPFCRQCGGTLKPHVVFFGEGVERRVVDCAFDLLGESEALLVAGSSLAVFSGYRFVRQALKDKKPVYVVNIGPTRADPVATLKLEGPLGPILRSLAKSLGNEAGAP